VAACLHPFLAFGCSAGKHRRRDFGEMLRGMPEIEHLDILVPFQEIPNTFRVTSNADLFHLGIQPFDVFDFPFHALNEGHLAMFGSRASVSGMAPLSRRIMARTCLSSIPSSHHRK
jgi:hypothetical protein